ncbi:hypothetical protein PISL3812_00651 [Talaromyces islandicus]|uniref:Uncharacterized protein n=1 Tax=Talaromyces islandicus TaxID=28573 RepID=A0A0U1LLW2_TALIS|nr:hypothetical protein PISL3812_00651 [Talaromyces islandicus]
MAPTICGRCAASGLRPSQRQLSSTKSWRFDSDIRRQKHSAFRPRHEFDKIHSQILCRYASSSSSSSSTKNKPLKAQAEPKLSSILADVNPPASTRPPALDRPPTLPRNSSIWKRFGWLISTGRAFLRFYKAGLKNVYQNQKVTRPMRIALGLPSFLPTSMPPARGHHGPSSSSTALISQMDSLKMSRADFQLVRRSAYDIRRMIPFGLILLVCGEFTPLLVAMLGNAVTPFVCRLPKQNDKTRKNRHELKRQALLATQADLGSATPIPSGSDQELEWLAKNFGSRDVIIEKSSASAQFVLRGCAAFGLVKSLNRPPWLVSLVYRPRLIRWAEYLELDDKMLLRGSGVKALNAEEVRIAVEERGGVWLDDAELDPVDREARNREWLARWFAARRSILEGS